MTELTKQERVDAAEAALYRLEGKEYLMAVDALQQLKSYFDLKPDDALLLLMELGIASV